MGIPMPCGDVFLVNRGPVSNELNHALASVFRVLLPRTT